jgi:hypothetical protein
VRDLAAALLRCVVVLVEGVCGKSCRLLYGELPLPVNYLLQKGVSYDDVFFAGPACNMNVVMG